MQTPAKITNKRYRLNYHITTPSGWMNDPNGFSYYKGYYHVFYQYYPYSAKRGPMHWGHYRSQDLVHWEELPVALTPNSPEDKDGCYSGSAIEKDGRLYLIYTGNHYYDVNDHSRFYQTQNVAFSDDGIHFEKYSKNPVIALPPTDNSQHFRDPKVWQDGNEYYIVVGGQDKKGLGRAITYKSTDLLHWDYLGPITVSQGADIEGYTWECPDLFSLGREDVLLCSPQGIVAKGKEYLNCYQTGYFIGKMDYRNNQFKHGAFQELDHGHDFYAAQTMLTPDDRRIVFGWLDMWYADFPEQADGWCGALTLPRELTLKNDQLYMTPINELKQLRQEKVVDEKQTSSSMQVNVSDPQHLELLLTAKTENWSGNEISFIFKNEQENLVTLSWNKENNEVILIRADKSTTDAQRYGKLRPNSKLKIQVFIDTSSIEFFLNDGELVFSERYYTTKKPAIFITADAPVNINAAGYSLAE
ncbi:sucrose-6-phosphate hydrolase [uncultured Lactobacillus sp.]|uniref:glycoside hydrolase family 32 protein n=1 Tax=uncultured Lactobacillus sp. TaxID=153152 RepID=UPI0025D690F6|nr:sucrose-6-phosphate hydrolase [uncultured Lactobacillus sp.]